MIQETSLVSQSATGLSSLMHPPAFTPVLQIRLTEGREGENRKKCVESEVGDPTRSIDRAQDTVFLRSPCIWLYSGFIEITLERRCMLAIWIRVLQQKCMYITVHRFADHFIRTWFHIAVPAFLSLWEMNRIRALI